MTAKKDITTDESAARAYFEGIRWPNGPFCPHCGSTDKVYRLEGKSHRPGLFHCNACSGQFTVTTGSVMESSHIPLNKWAFGFRLYAASKKGFSAHQLHRMIGITYKSAWFMAHRIREAMDEPKTEPMGGSGKTVETDETFIGGLEKNRHNIKRKRMGTGQFSILKRGILGTYHHVSPQHLHRYLSEFDFRYSNRASVGVEDTERMARAVKGAAGKRLYYRQAGAAKA